MLIDHNIFLLCDYEKYGEMAIFLTKMSGKI